MEPFKLTPDETNRAVNALGNIPSILARVPGVFYAGGLVRHAVDPGNELLKDIDIFTSADAAQTVIKLLTAGDYRYSKYQGPIATTLETSFGTSPKVQVIGRWDFKGDPETLISRFDFSMCQGVIWQDGGEWHSLLGPHFRDDVEEKRLRYMNPDRDEGSEPGGSMLRALRFVGRGYTIHRAHLCMVAARWFGRASGIDRSETVLVEELLEGIGEISDG